MRTLGRADCIATPWTASWFGNEILGRSGCVIISAKEQHRPFTATLSLWFGIIRGTRSFSRSTSEPATSAGALRATRSTRGQHLSLSSTEGRYQVVIGAMDRVVSYDLETGEIIWESDGLTMNPIPSPVAADGFVYLTSGYRGNNLKAVRLADATGDITGTAAIVWSFDRNTPYVPSPLLYDDTLYIIKSNSGILSAFEAKTGAPYYQTQRLRGVPNVFASPVRCRRACLHYRS